MSRLRDAAENAVELTQECVFAPAGLHEIADAQHEVTRFRYETLQCHRAGKTQSPICLIREALLQVEAGVQGAAICSWQSIHASRIFDVLLDKRVPPSERRPGAPGPRYASAVADDTTPSDLERELGIDQRRIRHYLRQQYGNLPSYTDNWHLNARAAEDVRTHFRAEAEAARASGEVPRGSGRTEPRPAPSRSCSGTLRGARPTTSTATSSTSPVRARRRRRPTPRH